MATLYELASDLRTVIDGGLVFDEETGEVIFDETNLDELEKAYADKFEAVALFVKNIESDAAAIRAEEKALAERRIRLEKKAERLKAYALDHLDNVGGKFETPRVTVSTRRSEVVSIYAAADIPEALTRTKTEPDKTAIKKLIKSGQEVPGAVLIEKKNLAIK